MINQICSFPFNFHFISAFGFGIGFSLFLCLWHFELPASFPLPFVPSSSLPYAPRPVNMHLPVPVEAQSSFKNIRNFDLCSLWLRVSSRLWLLVWLCLPRERERECLWCEWVRKGSVGLSSANFPLWLWLVDFDQVLHTLLCVCWPGSNGANESPY